MSPHSTSTPVRARTPGAFSCHTQNSVLPQPLGAPQGSAQQLPQAAAVQWLSPWEQPTRRCLPAGISTLRALLCAVGVRRPGSAVQPAQLSSAQQASAISAALRAEHLQPLARMGSPSSPESRPCDIRPPESRPRDIGSLGAARLCRPLTALTLLLLLGIHCT